MKPHLPIFLRSALLRCVTTAALIATCSSYAYADTEPLTLTFNEAEAPIVLLSGDDLLVNETGNTAILTAAASLSSSDGLILAGTTTYTNGTYTRSNETENLNISESQDFQSYESILFEKNFYDYGGAIYVNGCTLTFSENGTITFSGNTASYFGGAIYTDSSSTTFYFYGNDAITFSGNTAGDGGAIFPGGSGTLTFYRNDAITFSGNTASRTGRYSSSSAYGGAIAARFSSKLSFRGNGDITFSGNTASSISGSASGGAIAADSDKPLTFSENGDITFSGNTVSSSSSSAYGGAIYAYSNSTLTFSGNGNITFSGNKASGSSSAYGGAICAAYYNTFSGNSSIIFSGNTASTSGNDSDAEGGAIYATYYNTFRGNGDITFSGNTASGSYACGGAIYVYGDYATLTFTNNGDITFSGNKASSSYNNAQGGAIYVYENTLTIQGSALFEKNTEISKGTYRLRSIYQDGGSLKLSAPTDKSIEFRDSIYSAASTVSLNKDYTRSDGTTQKADGTIRFTGATSEKDLKEMKGGTAGTEEEITNSRTSELTGAVTLYGGHLVVEEKAILNISGSLTVEGGNITVATGAQLNLAKADITMPSLTLSGGMVTLGTEADHAATLTTTALTVTANSTLNGNLVMKGGTLTFAKDATLTMGCSVTIGSDVVVVLDDEVISALSNGTQTSLTLFTSAEDINIGQVTVQNSKGEAAPSNVKLEAKGGTIIATPEPATTTLSLLALAGLAVRRRRH